MRLFYPTEMLDKISDITAEKLASYGVSALILDVDNTLAGHGDPVPDESAVQWLETMKKAGIDLVIASNNGEERVSLFAALLALPYTANAKKPLSFGFSRIAKSLGLAPSAFGVVGDQIFTDVLGGNLFGAKTFLVKPLSEEEIFSIRLKRKIEAVILKPYYNKRKGRL